MMYTMWMWQYNSQIKIKTNTRFNLNVKFLCIYLKVLSMYCAVSLLIVLSVYYISHLGQLLSCLLGLTEFLMLPAFVKKIDALVVWCLSDFAYCLVSDHMLRLSVSYSDRFVKYCCQICYGYHLCRGLLISFGQRMGSSWPLLPPFSLRFQYTVFQPSDFQDGLVFFSLYLHIITFENKVLRKNLALFWKIT